MKNKSIIYSLAILAILTFGVITIPTEASADRAGWVTPYGSTRFDNRVSKYDQFNNSPLPYNFSSGPVDYSAAPIVYSNSPKVSTNTSTTKTVAKTSTTVKEDTKTDEDYSNLAANAVLGSNSFMPSGLVQWILFAIFILIVVILVRRVTGTEDKYHSEPLKHA